MEPLSSEGNSTRHRRGLFDAGGSLLHVLFGVATTSQVNKYTHLVWELKHQNKAILHNIPILATHGKSKSEIYPGKCC